MCSWARQAPAADPAPSKASCAEAYESAQESRASGALQDTRSRLAFCAKTECPAFVQKDCARWLEEVDRELPSVVLSVVGLDAEAARAASLKIDGRAVPEPLSGKTISLDPGKHELVLERPGAEPLTRTILAQQGVQHRSVEIRLDDTGPSVADPSAFDTDTAGPSSSPLRSVAYASWGVGAVGLGAFAVLGTLARTDKDRFEEECAFVTSTSEMLAPGVCLDTEVDRRKSRYEREEVLADVGLVTGLVGAAAGTVLFVLSLQAGASAQTEPSSSARLHLDLAPTPGGAWASVSGAF
ncbi:MAG: hypothetical protein ABI895_04785 [Deltaproteobacteria bacterium]